MLIFDENRVELSLSTVYGWRYFDLNKTSPQPSP
ncbi:hypothetical protein NIES3585_05650 [Nodularia sp. NIES-3585]|nr:hypothetical protein NIES3585_05650 [Nodularia sp. NIES-3585]